MLGGSLDIGGVIVPLSDAINLYHPLLLITAQPQRKYKISKPNVHRTVEVPTQIKEQK